MATLPAKFRHEEFMDEVSPNIWLGQFEAALDEQSHALENNNITHVVSLGCFYGWWSLRTKPKHLLIPIEDKPHIFITDYFNDVFRFMDEALDAGQGVLVHCEQGRSRSGAMVIAYIMKKERQAYPDVLNVVLLHRKRVMPNIGFQIQLRAFASNNFDTSRKYSELINLERELSHALANLQHQVVQLDQHLSRSERVHITLSHDGANTDRTDEHGEFGVSYPGETMDTRHPADRDPSDERPLCPHEQWDEEGTADSPLHWTRYVQVGLTTEHLAKFRKEWVLLVFLSHQFQMYDIPVPVEILTMLYTIGDCYFDSLLETFADVFRALFPGDEHAMDVDGGDNSEKGHQSNPFQPPNSQGSRPEQDLDNERGSRPAQRIY